jgi:hypothetical protein
MSNKLKVQIFIKIKKIPVNKNNEPIKVKITIWYAACIFQLLDPQKIINTNIGNNDNSKKIYIQR